VLKRGSGLRSSATLNFWFLGKLGGFCLNPVVDSGSFPEGLCVDPGIRKIEKGREM
jgi:hypothetical protein